MTKTDAQHAQEDGVRPASGEVTRARLIDAAASLVAERGWGSVTTRAVAERAGVNQALVHYHFGNMENLLAEAVLSRLQPVIQDLAAELLDDRPFPDGIVRTMQQLDQFDLESETGVLMAEALLKATRDERVAEAMSGVVGSWTEMLEPRVLTAQERGTIRADIPAGAIARVLAAVFDGYLIQRMADPTTDSAAAAATVIKMLAPMEEGTT